MTEIRYKPVNLNFICSLPEEGEDVKKCPIILIHGFFTNKDSWSSLRCFLATKSRRKVYCIDMRNHGRSEYTDEMTLYHIVADLENFMISQNIPKAIVVGHSMGGRVAMALALRKPEMVEKLAVEDFTITDTATVIESFQKLRMLARFIEGMLQTVPANILETDLQKNITQAINKVYPEAAHNFGAANKVIMAPLIKDKSGKFKFDFNLDPLIKDIQSFNIDLSTSPQYFGKTLFMTGDKSPIKKETQFELMQKHFPDYQVYNFKGGFHVFHQEFQRIFLEKLLNFIEDEPL